MPHTHRPQRKRSDAQPSRLRSPVSGLPTPVSGLLFLLLAALLLTTCTSRDVPEGFTVLVENAPQGIDPRYTFDDIGVKISQLVFAGLVTFDTPDSSAQNVLAESIEQVSPRQWDVTLKPDLTFHDGSPLTTADVEFTFESTPHLMEYIDRIEVHGPRAMSFHLNRKFSPFQMALSTGIVSKKELAGAGDDATGRIGAGPYRLVEGPDNQFTVLERFDDYVMGRPSLDRVVFRVVPDDNARIIALLGGSADLALNNVTPLMLPVVRDDPGLKIETDESIKYTYLMFNLNVGPLDDERVRKAIAYAIDREEIVEYKFRGLATLATGMLAPSHWAYESDVPRYERDLDRARQLLDEAGYPDPPGDAPRFSVTFRTSASKFRKAIAELIAAHLGEVGIDVDVETMEFGTFYAQIKEGNFELATLQWPSPIEPDLMHWVYHSSNIPYENADGQGGNRGGYVNERVDELLDEARATADRDARIRLYGEVQKILADELPYVPLWHEHNIAVMDDDVSDFQIVPNARLQGLVEVEME